MRCPLPGLRKKCRPLRCWEVPVLGESQAGLRYTRLVLCLEPVQASVAPVRPSHQLAQSMYLSAHLSTLPKYLQSWLQFWTNPGAHAHWRKRARSLRLLFVVSVFVQSLPFGWTVHDAEEMVEGACARWMGADREGATFEVGDVAKREGRAPTHRQASQRRIPPHVPVRQPQPSARASRATRQSTPSRQCQVPIFQSCKGGSAHAIANCPMLWSLETPPQLRKWERWWVRGTGRDGFFRSSGVIGWRQQSDSDVGSDRPTRSEETLPCCWIRCTSPIGAWAIVFEISQVRVTWCSHRRGFESRPAPIQSQTTIQ